MDGESVERPPRFRPDDVVRIVSAAPSDAFGTREIMETLVGRDGVVWSAHPAADHRSWRIVIQTLYLDGGDAFSVFDRDDPGERVYSAIVHVPEEVLESTGLVEERDDEGEGPARYVPLERATGAGWRDHLEVALFGFLGETRISIDEENRDWKAIEVIQEAAASAARELVASEEDVRWTGYDSVIKSFIVYPSGDVLGAYARMTAAPPDGWIHAEDRWGWPLSSWRRQASSDDVFLAGGLNNAEVTCRPYGEPKATDAGRTIMIRPGAAPCEAPLPVG